jgi:hypothetical protein
MTTRNIQKELELEEGEHNVYYTHQCRVLSNDEVKIICSNAGLLDERVIELCNSHETIRELLIITIKERNEARQMYCDAQVEIEDECGRRTTARTVYEETWPRETK